MPTNTENNITKRFMHLESSQIPLAEVSYDEVKENCIDPVTKKPYKGIILFGVFADLSNENPNNNRRYYDVEQYLNLLADLRKKVFDGKGVYGELEHPQGYAVNYNNVSHKILDVWYNPASQQVLGYVLLLNTPSGKKAQEIIHSGGKVAISARAAGEEITKNDGTKMAYVKLLTTYDIVCHPGFSQAVLEFKELNESQQFIQSEIQDNKYSFILYDKDVKRLNESYNSFLESGDEDKKCFLTWLNESKSYQSQEDKQDIKKLQNNEVPKQTEKESNLESATDQDLSERENSKKISRNKFMKSLKNNQKLIRKNQKLDRAVFDNSAGFLTNGISGVPKNQN